MYRNFILAIGVMFFAGQAIAAEWTLGDRKDDYGDSKKVSLKSADGENELYIFRKSQKSAAVSRHSKNMVYLGFKTNSIDQINRRSAIIYKASQGRALSLGGSSKIAGFDNKIESVSFHGSPEANCGIIGNILNSNKLTVRYSTINQVSKDVVFDLPEDNSIVYTLLGFTKGKECTQIFE